MRMDLNELVDDRDDCSSFLTSGTVLYGHGATDEVILHIHHHENTDWVQNLQKHKSQRLCYARGPSETESKLQEFAS